MMTIAQDSELAAFGSIWAVLADGHNVADHVLGQSDRQAANKGAPTADDVAAGASPRRGRAACLAYVSAREPGQNRGPWRRLRSVDYVVVMTTGTASRHARIGDPVFF
ncbi:hypothetical protein ABT234_08480 [Streptomyces sp. NPDC001586]|uniref:hypothetical protein n=1 Tax=Streptomyces sp. NPDC001586 TaxID=3154387 RepID=UPI003327D6B9